MPKIDQKVLDKLTSMEADWPDSSVVPELPPVPDAVNPPPPKDNYLWTHWNDSVHPQAVPYDAPLTDIVSDTNPLKVDVCWSMRSPYSSLVLPRLVYLHSNYNVKMRIRTIFPVAVRTRAKSGKAGSGRWYKTADGLNDFRRTGQYNGIERKWPNPDPIWQNMYPQGKADGAVHPLEKQPYIAWLVRLANVAEILQRSVEFQHVVHETIWGARYDWWPDHVESNLREAGFDYDAMIKMIRDDTKTVDAVWQENQVIQQQAGHGGVPLMIFRGEPFFGQDRFGELFWRLRQNGLTLRREQPRAPITPMPLRWPN
jgi:2-hydroxychromene-2-carboxylate isomerase